MNAIAAADIRPRAIIREKFAAQVVFAWALLTLAVDLKVALFLRIHWVATAIALVLLYPYLSRVRWWVKFPARTPVVVFLLAVLIPALYGTEPVTSLGATAKLALILVAGTSLFVARRSLAHSAFQALPIIVYVNLALVVGGLLGLDSAGIMATGRWGTLVNYPGSLWRVAISVWIFAAYFVIKKHSIAHLALLAASTLLVFMDGSRTGLLLILLGCVFLVYLLAAETVNLKRGLYIAAAGVAVLALIMSYSGFFSFQGGSQEEGGVGRMREMATNLEEGGVEAGLAESDIVRYQMLADAVIAIREHPIWGTGTETTISDTVVGPMPIHMTYLQVWADLGIFGLVAFTWMVWSWIVWLPSAFRRIRALPDVADRALYYNAIFLLLMFGVMCIFHPLSTEWTEWILFVIPYALLWEIVRPSCPPNKSHA